MFDGIKKIGTGIFRYWKAILIAILIVVGMILSATCGAKYVREKEIPIWKTLVIAPEPESCAICGKDGDGTRYHAPCLLNLSSGVLGELTVYDPDRFREGEIAEHQQTGVMSLLHFGEFSGMRDAEAQMCHGCMPMSKEAITAELYCLSCRAMLGKVATEGYVLLDFYDLDDVKAYPVHDGALYDIRDYSISINWDKEMEELAIWVHGKLFED